MAGGGVLAQDESQSDIEGNYATTSINSGGYDGILRITRSGEVYQFSWVEGAYYGVGLRRGERVSVGWTNTDELCGVVSYRIHANGTLEGSWAAQGQEGVGSERAVQETDTRADLTGVYSVTGTNQKGNSYTGHLTITLNGEVYEFSWQAGGTYRGIGLRQGDHLAVSWGAESCGVAVYQIQPDGALEGIWALPGQAQPSSERAVPHEGVSAYERFQEGKALFDAGRLDEALAAFQDALELSRKLGNQPAIASLLNSIGQVYDESGQADQALDYFNQSLALYAELGDEASQGFVLNNIGTSHAAQGRNNLALEYYQRALTIHRKFSNRGDQAVTLNNIGQVYAARRQYDQALDHLNRALVIHRENDRYREAGDTLDNIGSVYLDLGNYDQALDFLNQALAVRRKTGDRRGEGITLGDIGFVYEKQGLLDRALDHYHLALEIHRETRNRRDEGTALNNIAGIEAGSGQYEDALAHYNEALAIRIEVGDRVGEGLTLGNMAGFYRDQQQWDDALLYYERALHIWRDLQDRWREGVYLSLMARVYRNSERWDESLDAYGQALAVHREVGNRFEEALALGGIGHVYRTQGQYGAALRYYRQARAIMRALGNRSYEALAIDQIGLIYENRHDYQTAVDYYQIAAGIYAEIGNCVQQKDIYDRIAALYETQGNDDLANTFRASAEALECRGQPSTPDAETRIEPTEATPNPLTATSFKVVNQSQEAICFVRMVDSNGAASDLLGATETVLPDATQEWSVKPGTYRVALHDCGYDLMEEWADVDLSEAFTLTYDRQVSCNPFTIIGLTVRANGMMTVGDLNQAVSLLRQALPIARACDQPRLKSAVLGLLGLAYQTQGNTKEALIYLNEALEIAEGPDGTRDMQMTARGSLGLVYFIQGNYPEAERNIRRSLRIASEIPFHLFIVTELYQLGYIYYLQGDLEQALTTFEEALAIARAQNMPSLESLLLIALGDVRRLQGRHIESFSLLKLGLNTARKAGNHDAEFLALSVLGLTHADQGRYTLALDFFNQAASFNRSSFNRLVAAELLSNIGAGYLGLGQYDEAQSRFNEALGLAQANGIILSEAQVLVNLANLYASRGQYALALDSFNQALARFESMGWQSGKIAALAGLAAFYEAQNRHGLALEKFEEALDIARRIGERQREGQLLHNIGGVLAESGQPELALEKYRESLAIRLALHDRDGEGITRHNMGEAYRLSGQYDLALAFLEAGLAIHREVRNPIYEAAALNAIGRVYFDQGQPEQALAYFDDALALSQGNPVLETLLLVDRGSAYEQTGQPMKAIADYRASVDNIEQVIAGASLDTAITGLLSRQENNTPYGRLAVLLAQQGQREEALDYAERGRAILARRELTTGLVDFNVRLDETQLQTEIELRIDVVAAQTKVDQLNNELLDPLSDRLAVQKALTEAQDTLDKARNAYQVFVDNLRLDDFLTRQTIPMATLPLADIQAALPDDTTLLVYSLSQPESVVFLVTPTALEAVRLNVTRQQLEDQKDAFVVTRQTTEGTAALRKLYDSIFAPIVSKITSRHLIISPDGPLNYVPFAALQAPNGRFLIDDYVVSTTPSGTVLALLSRRAQSGSSLPALVLSQSSVDGFPLLRKSVREVAEVAQLLSVEANLNATETQLRSNIEGKGVLYISAHATMDQSAPLYSAIYLGKDSQNDGRLEVREIYELDLSKTQLVVLSGCDTGSGGSGEDFGLFNRAFLTAGAQQIVASLWSVDEQATADLLTAFIQAWKNGVREDEALQQAMLATRQRYPEPYYWASFVLTGQP
jgi:tetratricopeptide (TPR) repeat protein